MTKKTLKDLLIVIVVATVYLTLFSPYTTLLNDYYGYDTALWNVIGRGIVKGYVPYRDLFEHKGPLLFFIYAFQWLFSNHRLAMFILQLVFFVITLFYLLKTSMLFFDTKLSWICIGFFLFVFCGTIGEGAMSEELCLPWISIAIYSVTYYCKTNDLKKIVPMQYGLLLGILCGIVVMVRMNNAAPIVGFLLVLIVYLCINRNYISLLKNAASFLGGFLLPCIPIIWWYLNRDALNYMWWGAFLFNFHYSTNANVVQPMWEIVRPWLASSPILAFLIVVYKRAEMEEKKNIFVFYAVACVFTSVIIMFGSSFMHYFTLILPFYMFAFGWIIELVKAKKLKNRIFAFALMAFLLAPFTWLALRNAGKSFLLNTQGWYDGLQSEIAGFLDQIPLEDRDKVWGNGTSFSKVYCIGDITPCFAFIDNGPVHYSMDPTMEDKTVEMFETNPPKWIVVVNIYEPHIEALIEFVPKMYEHVDTLEGEKHLELYRLLP